MIVDRLIEFDENKMIYVMIQGDDLEESYPHLHWYT